MGLGIGGMIGTSIATSLMEQVARGNQRPNREQFAEKLFSKLDTAGQGYVDKASLQAAASQAMKPAEKAAANIEALFSKLDADSDGKLTLQEFTGGLKSAIASKIGGSPEQGNPDMNGVGGARQIMHLMNAYGLNAKPATADTPSISITV